jgi:hypothetical protein
LIISPFCKVFLTALHNYSNHSFLFEPVDDHGAQIIEPNKLVPCTQEQLFDTFKIWLYNSTADFFYENHLLNYSPIFELTHWKKLPHYSQQTAFIDAKIEPFFDLLEVDFFAPLKYPTMKMSLVKFIWGMGFLFYFFLPYYMYCW